MEYFQGFYKPKHPKKYKGRVDKIVYRSSWEFKYMRKLDEDDNVIEWSSEEMHVAYPCPLDPKRQKWRRYFPDFIVTRKEGNKINTYMIEIKPLSQTQKPKSNKNKKQYLNEAFTYAINQSKWIAAEAYCKKRGWKFEILTERQLGIR